jgi:hypothetical protein
VEGYLVKCLVCHHRADTGGVFIAIAWFGNTRLRLVVAQVKLVIFSHHSAFGVAIGVGELGYDVDSIVITLDTGEVIDFGEPLLAAFIIDAGDPG